MTTPEFTPEVRHACHIILNAAMREQVWLVRRRSTQLVRRRHTEKHSLQHNITESFFMVGGIRRSAATDLATQMLYTLGWLSEGAAMASATASEIGVESMHQMELTDAGLRQLIAWDAEVLGEPEVGALPTREVIDLVRNITLRHQLDADWN